MRKKPSGSSAQGRRVEKSVKHIPDSQIDFSDIPEATDAELKRMRRVSRPAGQRHGQAVNRYSSVSETSEPASQDGCQAGEALSILDS